MIRAPESSIGYQEGSDMPSRRAALRLLASFILAVSVSVACLASAGQMTTFDLGPVGVALNGTSAIVAASLNNTGNSAAFHVSVASITLHGAAPTDPTVFPVAVGEIANGKSATVQATFDATQLTPGQHYTLVVEGSYQAQTLAPSHARCPGTQPIVRIEEKTCSENPNRPALVRQRACCLEPNGHTHCKPFAHCPAKVGTGKVRQFDVSADVVLPPLAPGSAALQTTTADAQSVTGAPFLPFPPAFEDDEENGSNWIVPTGPFVAGTPTASNTGALQAPRDQFRTRRPREAAGVVTFNTNDAVVGQSTTAEPSGASGGGVIFVSANWFAAFSTDGGATYTTLDPTTVFPADAVGFCCDQVVQYVPSIDRFVWLLQGNGVRIAVASPADIINSGGTAWTYWNLTPGLFGQPSGTGFDYPDLSVGNGALYMSWDAGSPCGTGCRQGFQVARTSLAGLQAGASITIDFTDPQNSPMAWGSHLTQDTLDEVFWAGHNTNSQMRVFSLAEGSNTYFWRDIGIASWANDAPVSKTPDGQDWLAKNFNGPNGNSFPRNGVVGATRAGSQVWFGWSAGTDGTFQQPHVELVTLDRGNDFALVQQQQIWNNGFAFAYPALATNACTGEIGLSLEYGGGGNYENHVVGFWGDFVVYATTSSNTGTARFGDYVTIRQTPGLNGAFFDAFGYGLNSAPRPGPGVTVDVRHVQFGRGGSCQGPS